MPLGQTHLRQDEIAMLLARCAQADTQAFQQLYVLERDRLFGIALLVVHDRHLASDVLHDTMLQAWHNAARYDPERGSGQVWLTSLLRYRAIDAAARSGRDMHPHRSDPPDIEDPSPDPYEQLLATREAQLLALCLETVDERQRSLIVAAYLGGLTHAQLAARTGEPLGTIKSAIRRALRALRRCMDDPPL